MTARPRVVVLGRQGSGKGTQGMRLASQLGVPHLSTGDLFRAAVRAGTEVGAEVDHLLKEGLLVPDDLVIDVVLLRAIRMCLTGKVNWRGTEYGVAVYAIERTTKVAPRI